MSNGWSAKSVAIPGSISGIVTNQAVTSEYSITAGGALNCAIKVAVTGVTVVGAITAKLQTAINNDWVDAKTASITVNGNVYIKLQAAVAGDQSFLPLLNKGRVVISTTNAGDVVTISSIEVLQEL